MILKGGAGRTGDGGGGERREEGGERGGERREEGEVYKYLD